LQLRKPFKFDDNGRIYIGEWNTISNLIEGFGQVTYMDGVYYEAYFKNSYSNGLCKQFYNNGYYEV
jgi:hypothetical protein